MRPAQLPERLADFRWRELPPPVLAEQIAGGVPMEAFGIRATVLELTRAPSEAAAAQLQSRSWLTVAVFGLNRERASERVETEERIGSGHERDFGNGDLRDQIP